MKETAGSVPVKGMLQEGLDRIFLKCLFLGAKSLRSGEQVY